MSACLLLQPHVGLVDGRAGALAEHTADATATQNNAWSVVNMVRDRGARGQRRDNIARVAEIGPSGGHSV